MGKYSTPMEIKGTTHPSRRQTWSNTTMVRFSPFHIHGLNKMQHLKRYFSLFQPHSVSCTGVVFLLRKSPDSFFVMPVKFQLFQLERDVLPHLVIILHVQNLVPVFLIIRPFATSDHVVQNPPCLRASSLLSPHWDINKKRPELVNLDLPLF